MAAIGAAVDTAGRSRRRMRRASGRIGRRAEEVRALKARDNVTNWLYLARIYLVIAAAIAAGVWVIEAARAGEISWWVDGSRDSRRHRRHRRLTAPVRRRHPRRHALHAVRQPHAQRAGVRLAGGVADPDDDLSLPPASPRAPPVRQRSAARSRHQPAARERSLARLPDHPRRGAVEGAEAAVAAEPLPLHDHPRQVRLARHRNAQPLRRSGASRQHPAGARRHPFRGRRSAHRHPAHRHGLRAWRWRSSCR